MDDNSDQVLTTAIRRLTVELRASSAAVQVQMALRQSRLTPSMAMIRGSHDVGTGRRKVDGGQEARRTILIE